MYWTKTCRSTRAIVYSLSCLLVAAAMILWLIALPNQANAGSEKNSPEGGNVITGTGTGAIPDGGPNCGPVGAPLNISFDANSVSGTVSSVEVNFSAQHTWVGDLNATLMSPAGTEHVLFAHTGSTITNDCGTDSDLDGIYSFSDGASGDWWTAADLNATLPVGAYRTTSPGDSPSGGAFTNMDPVFAGESASGTWTLRIEDGAEGDTGGITAANLTITTATAVSANPSIDFNGDGEDDYSVLRDSSTPLVGNGQAPKGRRSIEELNREPGFRPIMPGGENAAPAVPGSDLVWYIHNSGANTARVDGFGQPATDFYVPADYDGDDIDDLAVWRGVAFEQPNQNAFFYIFRSSDQTVSQIDFGQIGDNPTVVGDYDNDGTDDPAVYRCPDSPGQCTWFFRGSNNNPNGDITYFPWGNGTTLVQGGVLRPYPGDFDGDGANDFCVFENGQYNLYRSSDGGVEYINWGQPGDAALLPGDYDGDGMTDFMNGRLVGNAFEWWLLERDGASSTTVWGSTAVPNTTEFVTPADFDGDGSTDIAIWRRDDTSNDNSFFYVLRSSDLMLETFEWGSMGDVPLPGWNAN